MKTIRIALIALLVVAGTAAARDIVDFSVLTSTVGLTAPPPDSSALTLNGVTFTYDNAGSPDTSLDVAAADPAGLYGSTYGNLILDFNRATARLWLDFTVQGVMAAEPSALSVSFFRGGNYLNAATVDGAFTPYDPLNLSGGGFISGSLAYTALGFPDGFDQASIYFSPVAAPVTDPDNDTTTYNPYFFDSGNIAYEAVPEPASFFLLGMGLLGLGGTKLLRRKA